MQDGPRKRSTEHLQFRLHAVHFVLNISVLSVCGPNLRSGCLVSYAMFCLLIKLHLFLHCKHSSPCSQHLHGHFLETEAGQDYMAAPARMDKSRHLRMNYERHFYNQATSDVSKSI